MDKVIKFRKDRKFNKKKLYIVIAIIILIILVITSDIILIKVLETLWTDIYLEKM